MNRTPENCTKDCVGPDCEGCRKYTQKTERGMMKKLIKYWDEDYLYENLYCQKEKCTECEGVDGYGQPNGYGCEGQEDYAGDELNQIIEDTHIPYYKASDIEELLERYKELEELMRLVSPRIIQNSEEHTAQGRRINLLLSSNQ